jgi:selenide,water dikinase
LVGNSSNDDAAVYDLGNGTALISTTDFFMPIVDDAFDFGRIAAANAISDVYAMGGKPILALAILGWPIQKLPTSLAQKVIEGARTVCAEAGIALAGGHSIDTLEPMFGLSVNGLVEIKHLKKNNTAQEGDLLFLTKAIGVGVLSTAQKRGLLKEEDKTTLIKQLTQLNSFGEKLGAVAGVTAVTDVTGFGLLGHLIEMAKGSSLSAVINYSNIIKIEGISFYLNQSTIPDATFRNWNAYSTLTEIGAEVNVMEAFNLLPDPQTNGGLLFSVKPDSVNEIIALLKENGLEKFITPIGKMVKKEEKVIRVEK